MIFHFLMVFKNLVGRGVNSLKKRFSIFKNILSSWCILRIIIFGFLIACTWTSVFLFWRKFDNFRRCWLRPVFGKSVTNRWVTKVRFSIFLLTVIDWSLFYLFTNTEALLFRIIVWWNPSNIFVYWV